MSAAASPVRRNVTRPAAVLWDMDGTLVDTEPLWIEAEHALVAEHGGTWSTEHAHALVGNPLLVSAEYIREHGGVDLPPHDIVERLQAHVVAAVRTGPPWRPGALDLLGALAAGGVPCALVTMSWQPLAGAVVDTLPRGTFAAVVTGDRVVNGKPHPEAYLTAADALGVRPEDCVAIEDSPTGLAAAEAAGVPTVAVPHVLPLEAAPGRLLVASLLEVDVALLATLTERPASR